jgi:hypothetical protein
MRRAHDRRRENLRFNSVAQVAKLVTDALEADADVVADVFEEDERRLDFFDDASDVGPEVPRVLLALLFPGDAEGLTGISRRDEIHRSAPRAAVEGLKVTPDRRVRNRARFHSRDQNDGTESFPLHETDWASRSQGEVESKIKATHSRAERQDSGRWSHT